MDSGHNENRWPKTKSNSSKKSREEQKRIEERLRARRVLQTFPLQPPQYVIDPEAFLRDGGFYEKEIRVSMKELLIS